MAEGKKEGLFPMGVSTNMLAEYFLNYSSKQILKDQRSQDNEAPCSPNLSCVRLELKMFTDLELTLWKLEVGI